MMDALARIEPVARRLLNDVDAALATYGAPPEHPVWSLLRRLGATPADVIASFAEVDPERIRAVCQALRDQVGAYANASIPAQIPWHGVAGEVYAARAHALNTRLHGDGPDSLIGRLVTTASYVEETATWYSESRDRIAAALADVLTSTQAVALAGGVLSPAEASRTYVCAAADIAAYLLEVVAHAVDEGHAVHRRWQPQLTEQAYRAPAETGPTRFDSTIRIRH